MPTHKADLTRLNVGQLAALVRCKPHTMRRRLDGLEPVQTTGRERLYNSADALARYFTGESLDLSRERARLAREQADATALRNAEARGELIDRHDPHRIIIALATATSWRMQGIPRAIALAVAAERSPAECERIIDGAIRAALSDLSDEGKRAQRELGKNDTGGAA